MCQIVSQSNALGTLSGFSRLIAIDADGKNPKMLTQSDSSRALGPTQYGGGVIDWTGLGKGGSVLMMRSYIPEATTGTRFASDAQGLASRRSIRSRSRAARSSRRVRWRRTM